MVALLAANKPPSGLLLAAIAVAGTLGVVQGTLTVLRNRRPTTAPTPPSASPRTSATADARACSFDASFGAKLRDVWNLGILTLFLVVGGGAFVDSWVGPAAAWAFEALVAAGLVRGVVRSTRLGVTIDNTQRLVTVAGFFRDVVVPYSSIYGVQVRTSINHPPASQGARFVALNVENRRVVPIAAATLESEAARAFHELAGTLGVPCAF